MITLKGKGLHPGIAIAVAAVVDFSEGPSSLPYSILKRASDALKRQLIPKEQPEVIMVTEQLVFGATLKIPGLQKAGLVAQSDDDAPGLPINVPCVNGVSGAMKIESESIVIVDGNSGHVFADPDVETLVRYQSLVEESQRKARVSLESVYLPATTLGGRDINVSARVRTLDELQTAVSRGADVITAEIRLTDSDSEDFIYAIMGAAAGKPVTFIPDTIVAPLLRFILKMSVPGQVTFAFPASTLNQQKTETLELIDYLQENELDEELPRPRFAVLARTSSDTYVAKEADVQVILERPKDEIEGAVRSWTSKKNHQELTVVLDSSLEMLPVVIKAGAQTVEVSTELIEEAKNMIRRLP